MSEKSEPLNYRNAAAPEPVEPTEKGPRAAIPVEFDQVVTRTKELAAARAIEEQLGRDGVRVYRIEDGEGEDATAVLLVRAADLDHAARTAAELFARRRRVKSFPR